MFVTSTVLAIALSLPVQFGGNGPTVSERNATHGAANRNYGTKGYCYSTV